MANLEILSVSEYLDKINSVLKGEKAKILGEISEVQMYEGRSYLYFSIRDKKGESKAKCFMWKRDFSLSGVKIEEGMEVMIIAYPNVYKPNGSMTLQVESIELVGLGALQIAYEKLKKKLSDEGLFNLDRKKEIKPFPHKIGVITSKSGAVINDFLTNIGKFGFEIFFVDSKVEGEGAVKDLLSAVKTLKKKDLDVLVIMRGGGGLESFLAFNNEILLREIATFPVPVLTGIGHDKDEPLLSLLSDKNVSTPSMVANFLNSSWNEALSKIYLAEEKILSNFISCLRGKQYHIENSSVLIQNRFKEVLQVFYRAEETLNRAMDMINSQIKAMKEKIVQFGKILEVLNPERQLKRGYSIVRKNGKVVKSKKDLKSGDLLDISLSDGIIGSQII